VKTGINNKPAVTAIAPFFKTNLPETSIPSPYMVSIGNFGGCVFNSQQSLDQHCDAVGHW
jgi:hypothetical protein